MKTFDIHSPEQEIEHPLLKEKGVRVFIKRDDKIHPFISGNKWRKLKYSIHEALEQEKKKLVTFGGAWSNHLLATAAAAAEFNFQSYGIVRGEEVENPVLTMCKLFGMHLQFVSREAYRSKENLFNEQFEKDPEAMYIPEGGYGKKAVLGCAEIIDELTRDYDALFCAAGTGATAAGLAQGILKHNKQTKLHVIPVLKGNFIPSEIEKLGVSTREIYFHEEYHFGGYAKTQPSLLRFVKEFTSHTGILIEPIYTGKSFFAAFDQIQKDNFPRGSHILLLHTGGLTGILGMYDKFSKI